MTELPAAPSAVPLRSDRIFGDDRAGSRAFDFLLGHWRVRNRRLVRPLSGLAEWEEFDAASVVRPLGARQGNIEEWTAPTFRGGLRAVSLHLFDPLAQQWRLHWATLHDGRVGVPTIGSFSDGLGEFYACEEFEGRSILLRIVWQGLTADTCRWEQSFSMDGGRDWETNWTMHFTRETPSLSHF
jgi:hypothetical protein